MNEYLLGLLLAVVAFALGMLAQWVRCRRVHRKRAALPALREREFRVALQVGEDNLLWRAVHQAIESQRESALAAAVDIDHQERPQLLSYFNGAAIHLEKLGEFLRDERERGLKELEDD
jgi:hypothetical protein